MRAALLALLVAGGLAAAPAGAQAACNAPSGASAIANENAQPGTPQGQWDIAGAGDPSIQGFATDISVNPATRSASRSTRPRRLPLDIYRHGLLRRPGRRKVATVQPSARCLRSSPPCLTDAATGLIDCGNWAESASWPSRPTPSSGIYFAKLVREDGVAGDSHVVFVVRDDDGRSDLLFQTSDTTWQAYNRYGGNSLYAGGPGRAAPSRSATTARSRRAGTSNEDWVFNSEYPMVRWLERNGYDVSYSTGVDSDRLGAEIREHKVFLSVGHDEYWSGDQRDNVEAARDAGVNLAFFSGNEVFWKTRWEIDGTPHARLLQGDARHAQDRSAADVGPAPGATRGRSTREGASPRTR